MINYQLTNDFVMQIVKEIESEENQRRKRIAYDSEQIKTGKLKEYVEARVKQMYPKTWQMYTVTDYSVLNKIVNKKSKAYNEPPIRKVYGDEAASEIYQNIVSKYGLNQAMKELDTQFNQHKHGLIACFMDRMAGPSARPNIFWKFYSLAPYEYDVIKDDDGQVKVVVLSYPSSYSLISNGDSYNSLIAEAGKADEVYRERFYSFWTDSEHIMVRVKGSGRSKDKLTIEFMPPTPEANGTNPYGVLPFVYVPMDYDKNYPNPSPLPMQTVEFNALMSVYLTSANMQVGVLKITRPEKQKLTISSHSLYTAIEAPQSSRPEDKPTDVQFISPQPNMTGHKEAIATYLNSILDEQGISGSQLINPNQEFSSGFDRLLSQSDVQQIIEENQQLYSKVEGKIYEIIAYQLASIGQATLPLEGFQVIYRKPKVMISDKEKLENLRTMKDLGLWPDYELVQMYDPNLSEDEAKDKLISIQQSKLEMASMFTDPSKVFNGAQVAAIVDVSSKVGTGEISAEAGVNILITSFGIPEEQARSMVSESSSIKEKEDTKEDEEEDKLEYRVNNANKPR
jgi:hypothetical protein